MKGFIDNKSKEFPKLKIDFVRGAPPKIMLKDASGAEIDSVRVDQWSTDNIVDFFKERLMA